MGGSKPGSNYAWAIPYLGLPIESVVEVGARDGHDAVALATLLSCRVDTFEASPVEFPRVADNIAKSGLRGIHAHELALSNECGLIDFWVVDEEHYANSGLGSFFEINFDNRSIDDGDAGHPKIQRRVQVDAARFDSLGLPPPALLVMDVQGSETKVLEGFGELLRDCRYVICEAERVPSYRGGNSFRELDAFLRAEGWTLRASTIGSGTNADRRIHYAKSNLRIALQNRTIRPWRIYQGCFDVLYVNSRQSRRGFLRLQPGERAL